MKLQIVSDLHMEFRIPPEIKNAGADALVLAGDICLAYHLHRHPISNLMRNNAAVSYTHLTLPTIYSV